MRPPAAARAAHAWPRPRVIGWAVGNRRGLDPFRGSRCFQTSLSQRAGSPRSGVSFRFKVRGGFRRNHSLLTERKSASIRFKVRGGFRPNGKIRFCSRCRVSIRFKVRGGFRPLSFGSPGVPYRFQSALRFAVASDTTAKMTAAQHQVSIRFKVRGGFRPSSSLVKKPLRRSSFNPL